MSQQSEQISLEDAQLIGRIGLITKFPDGGEIRTEVGADGVYILFDCECKDALPLCKAACCGMPGTYVSVDEIPILNEVADRLQKRIVIESLSKEHHFQMRRDADGFCSCLDRDKRLCQIYDDRPKVCRDFHCSQGIGRGHKLIHLRQQEYM